MEKMLRVNLAVKSRETLLIITDIPAVRNPGPMEAAGWEELNRGAELMAEVGKEVAGEVRFCPYPSTGGSGIEPPLAVWRSALGRAADDLQEKGFLKSLPEKSIDKGSLGKVAGIVRRLSEEAADVVVSMTAYSTSHTRFRDLLTSRCGCRYASMPRFDMDMFFGPMDVDYTRMARRTRRLAGFLTEAREARLRAPGTDITFSLSGRVGMSDTGIMTRSGSFGNLPAGEAYIAPLEGTARGIFTPGLDPAVTGDRPSFSFRLQGGRVVEVRGPEDLAGPWRIRLAEHPDNANLAELGIGTNDRASRPDNVLEAEKILGTVHLALGDSRSMGGRTAAPLHEDFVIWNPTLELSFPDGSRRRVDPSRLGGVRRRRS
jgi:leucyl aminopeptidase (aminopeptidase T)